MSERLTAAEAAETIGVHVNTIKHWIGQVSIPAEKDGAGRWRFSPEAVEVLHAIKGLRDQDRTFDTIRQRLDKQLLSEQQEEEQAPTGGRQAPTSEPPIIDGAELAASVAASIVPSVVEAIAQNNELAEKYARAAHQIGSLEAKVQAKDERIAQLTDELAEARQRITLLEAPKEMPAPRPWWKWWQGDR